VILDDASSQNRFAADTYLAEHHARSVLCLPIDHPKVSLSAF